MGFAENSTVVAVVVFLAFVLYLYVSWYMPNFHEIKASGGTTTSQNLCKGTGIQMNPEKGLARQCPLLLNNESNEYEKLSSSQVSLCFARIDLSGYVNVHDIREADLNQIHSNFGFIRDLGIKAIPRIVYSNDESGYDPNNLTIVRSHLMQLKPIFEQNKNVIAWFEAGIIGAW